MLLRCPYYYLLLFTNKLPVNITDFPVPLKIYKKNYSIDSHVKIQSEISDIVVLARN